MLPPLSHKAKLAKTFEKSKMPAPPSAKDRAKGPPTPGPGGFGEGFTLPELGLWPRGGWAF